MNITDDELRNIQEHYKTCKQKMQEMWNTFENKGGKVMWMGRKDDSYLLKAYLAYDIEAMNQCIEEYKIFLESMSATQGIEGRLF